MDVEEIWKPVVGHESIYEISDKRRVRRIAGGKGARAGRILKQRLDTHGCPYICLCLRGKATTLLVSHLVANAFLPPKSPTDRVLRHLNDDPTDNRIENLAWGTYSDNLNDAFRNGKRRVRKGVAHYCAKLTEDQVREIRLLYSTGNFTQRELARRFGVSFQTISDIVRRRNWKHIT